MINLTNLSQEIKPITNIKLAVDSNYLYKLISRLSNVKFEKNCITLTLIDNERNIYYSNIWALKNFQLFIKSNLKSKYLSIF